MPISVVNNSTAIGAQSSVNAANNGLNKTIRALSTGLRINSASDDASGLAVSEKLRAQISGLDKAATNAQDAISMLQTAEGAMGSMTSMVQRIRELAVQAGDPAYTANDRSMLQLEVDQLKQEIDRVSATSEFNTKKLLNGDAAAIWSASTDSIEAIIKGSPLEGNYKLTYDLDPGRNSVYKSNIMRVGEGEMSYDLKANGTSITKFDDVQNMLNEKNVTVTVSAGAATAAKVNLAGATGKLNAYFTAGALTGASLAAGSGNGYSVELEAVTSNAGAVAMAAPAAGLPVYSLDDLVKNGVKSDDIPGAGGAAEVVVATTAGTNYIDYKGYTFTIDAGSGIRFQANETTASLTAATKITSAATIDKVGALTFSVVNRNGKDYLQLNEDGVAVDPANYTMYSAQAMQMKYRVHDSATGAISQWENITVGTNGVIQDAVNKTANVGGKTINPFTDTALTITGANINAGKIEAGDRMLVNTIAATSAASTATSNISLQIGSTGSGIMIQRRPATTNLDENYTVHTAQMDNAGNVYYGSIDVTLGKGAVTQGKATIDILGEGDVASKNTKLSQLAQFTNADGRMLLDNTQEISIYAGNGNIAKLTLEGSDTIKDLEDKLNSALVNQLGLGADVNNTNATEINRNLVKFVETPASGDRAVQGTFVLQGAVLGADSNLTFVGDEGVLNALGVTQIQTAKDSALDVRVSDAHTGAFIGEDRVTDGRLRNIIQGVDVLIKPESAANVSFNAQTNRIEFKAKPESTEALLHIKSNATKAAIGSNEGQVLDVSIGRLDTVSLGINDVNVATFDSAQKSITKLDMALEQISAARATAGAQMNRLEYTITNLNTARENMVSSESRIRDLDIAKASTQLASQQVLLQSATAMLAQANQLPTYALQLLR